MMPYEVNIIGLTANTPINIFCCDGNGDNCQYISTISVVPYIFDVPENLSSSDFTVKIVDTQNLIDEQFIYVTPMATKTQTPTQTPTTTSTPQSTNTNTPTPTQTPSVTNSSTITPTQTPTVTTTPYSAPHSIGSKWWTTSEGALTDHIIDGTTWFTYINESNLIPVIGAKVYQTQVGSQLFNPASSNNLWRLMNFGNTSYAVRLDNTGTITEFVQDDLNCFSYTFSGVNYNFNWKNCNNTLGFIVLSGGTFEVCAKQGSPTSNNGGTIIINSNCGVTPTPTPTPTVTPTSSVTPTLTPTNTVTPSTTEICDVSNCLSKCCQVSILNEFGESGSYSYYDCSGTFHSSSLGGGDTITICLDQSYGSLILDPGLTDFGWSCCP